MAATSAGSGLRYFEVPPPPHLAPWIACAWSSRGDGRGVRHRVLPDGCVDLLVDAGAGDPEFRIVGPMSVAAVVPLGAQVDVIGIRFRPGGLALLSSAPVDALLDTDADPRDVFPRDILGIAAAREHLARESSSRGRIHALWHVLSTVAESARHPDPLVQGLLRAWRADALRRAPSFRTVRELARDARFSERTLERRARIATGFGPAELRRLVRFRHALCLHDAGVSDWAALAADAGYSDQPHLVREFRRFAGLTPTAWQSERVGFVQDGRIAAL